MRLRLCLLLCLLFSAMGIAHAYGDERADVRVINAISGIGLVDVYLNDTYAGNVDFSRAAQFISVDQGTVSVRIFAPESDPSGTPLFAGEFSARNDQVLNVVLSGAQDNITLNSYPVDIAPLEFGMSSINVIHALLSAGALTVNAVPASGDALTLAPD